MTDYTKNSDTITRDYLDSLLIETRYLDSVIADTSMELFGETFSTPIMTAALSHLHNTAPNGMVIYAEAAKKANAVHWVGMGEEDELEQIVATGARTIKIIKPHENNDVIYKKLEHAEKIGCFAVGMDIDHAFNGNGGYDEIFGLKMKAKSTEEIADFVKATKLPFIVKGVMSPKDAEKCVKAGVAGIQVSHHHGMVDYSVPPLMVIEDIIKATGNTIPVFADCGFASGMDVYKALALGAKAVSIGRHLMPILKEGSDKVAERMIQMNTELKTIMNRTGISDLSKMDSSVIHHRNF